MNDLREWLSQQHHGMHTFQLFRHRLVQLSEAQPGQKALYALLSGLVARYIEAIDDRPVPTAVADLAFERLLKLLASLDLGASSDGRLSDLNRVAAADLLAPTNDLEGNNTPLNPASAFNLALDVPGQL